MQNMLEQGPDFCVGSIKFSFRTIVFTQYMQRCFQSKCYYVSVKLCHFGAFHFILKEGCLGHWEILFTIQWLELCMLTS